MRRIEVDLTYIASGYHSVQVIDVNNSPVANTLIRLDAGLLDDAAKAQHTTAWTLILAEFTANTPVMYKHGGNLYGDTADSTSTPPVLALQTWMQYYDPKKTDAQRTEDRLTDLSVDSGVVGNVTLVYVGATAPAAAPTGVTWSQITQQLENVPTGWRRLKDFNATTDVPMGQNYWYSTAFVNRRFEVGTFSTPVFGVGALGYNTLAQPGSWHTLQAGADEFARFLRSSSWTPPRRIEPRATLDWHTLATVVWSDATPKRALLDVPINVGPDNDISEIMLRWRRRVGLTTVVSFIRYSPTVPVEDVRQALHNHEATLAARPPGSTPGSYRDATFVMFGWSGGHYIDILPLHSTFTLGNESGAADCAFFVSFMRPQGQDDSDYLGQLAIHQSTTPFRSAYIDLLGR